MNLKFILTTVLCALALSFAQNQAELTSATDMAKIDIASIDLNRNFVYKVYAEENSVTYKINMHDDLYKSHNSFVWPARIPSEQKLNMDFYADNMGKQKINEIIFNERIIFSITDSVYLKRPDNTFMVLRRISSPGISKVVGPIKVNIITPRQYNRSLATPIFHYTIGDKSDFLLVSQPGKVSEFISPDAAPMSYTTIEIQLQDLPQPPPPLELPPLIEDKDLEIQLAATEELLNQQKQLDSIWLDSITNHIIAFPAQKSDESDSNFMLREDLYALELSKHIAEIKSLFDQRYQLFEERKQSLDIAQKQKPAEKHVFEPKSAVELQKLWSSQSFIIGVQTVLGANLPHTATNPGPHKLRNVSLVLGYTDNINNTTFAWKVHSKNTYQRWLFNQDATNSSKRMSSSLAFSLLNPIFIQQNQNSAQNIYIELGVLGQYARSKIKWLSTSSSSRFSWGGLGSIGFMWSRGYSINLGYQYSSDQFGELSFGLTIPIYNINSELQEAK